jgi:uncharacterized cupredoxin-like copper-binding protein
MIGAVLAAVAAAVTPVGVSEREWHLTPYTSVVRHGTVRFQVHNFGEDMHNLQITTSPTPRGYRSAVTPDIAPGENGTLTVHLRPGRYALLCVKPGHVAKGMRATIRVR